MYHVCMETTRKPYPSDVSDAEWAFVVPYLALLPEDAEQRNHDLREVFNALRWLLRTGAPWRLLPHDLPPWAAVSQQTQRWIATGSFAWAAWFRRLARDYERLTQTLVGLHYVAFDCLMLHRAVPLLNVSS